MGIWSRLRGKGKGHPGILQKSRRLVSWADALERYGEATGVAQEGLTEQARELVLGLLSEPRKILVVTGQDGGSMGLRDYASSLAARMGCEIWHLVCSRPGSLPEWRRGQWDNPQLPCKEIFLEGDVESCIREALGLLKRVEFVLMGDQQPHELEVAVPVFTLLNETGN